MKAACFISLQISQVFFSAGASRGQVLESDLHPTRRVINQDEWSRVAFSSEALIGPDRQTSPTHSVVASASC